MGLQLYKALTIDEVRQEVHSKDEVMHRETSCAGGRHNMPPPPAS